MWDFFISLQPDNKLDMDTIITFAKENVDLISLCIGILGVLVAIASVYVEIRNKRLNKQPEKAVNLNPANRNAQIIKTSYIGIATNVLLAGFKAAVGLVASSVAIVMDAVNNLSDALSSVITIVGTKLSQRPADREHPFGYGRVEYFSAILIAVLVLWAGGTSLIESVKKIIHPTEPDYSVVTLTVIVLAIGVKLILGRYVKKKGQELKSDALIASGSDALFDAVITLSTLISAGIMLIWGISLDGILGTLISILIIKAGVEMLASPVNELLGARVSQDLVKEIKQEVAAFDGVHGVFDVILNNYGPDLMIGSLHVSVNDTMNAHEIHELTRNITIQMAERHGIVMTVGIYALATGKNRRADLQKTVMQAMMANPKVTQAHGLHYYEKENRLSVDVVPDISVHDEEALQKELTEQLKSLLPGMEVTLIIDHNYSD